jgi:hypothetical protein
MTQIHGTRKRTIKQRDAGQRHLWNLWNLWFPLLPSGSREGLFQESGAEDAATGCAMIRRQPHD